MKAAGLDKFGYTFVSADDCWASNRSAAGVIVPDPARFPNGMAPVVATIHALGFKFGIYTDRGPLTCQQRPGSFNYEAMDAQTYAQWGVDYLKEDSCYASSMHPLAFAEYEKMRDALNATGRPIVFSLCGWKNWYAPVGGSIGNLVRVFGREDVEDVDFFLRRSGQWRISGDVVNFKSMISAININSQLAQFAGVGQWNDPDMLLGSDATTATRSLTPTQSRTQFSMWSGALSLSRLLRVFCASISDARCLFVWSKKVCDGGAAVDWRSRLKSLCLGLRYIVVGDVIHLFLLTLIIRPSRPETYTNKEVIAVDQDPLGKQGVRVAGVDLDTTQVNATWAQRCL